MGDFWPGNILVTPTGDGGQIHILDWELAKPGLPGLDIGQFCAEMHLLRRFHPECADSASRTITTFLKAYGRAHTADTQLARTALVHWGAHLVAWTPRVPWGSKERTRDVVEEGAELLVEGYTGKEDWLKTSFIGPLVSKG